MLKYIQHDDNIKALHFLPKVYDNKKKLYSPLSGITLTYMKELYTSIEADNHWDETVQKIKDELRNALFQYHLEASMERAKKADTDRFVNL